MALMNWPYIAGFFDGEGNIRIVAESNRINPQISMVQSRERARREGVIA